MTAPIVFKAIEDGVLVPMPRFAKEACRQFEPDHTYWMEEVQERSVVSHNHEFAWLKQAWMNLPESLADQYPTPEYLRKRALIQAGYYNEEIIDAGTSAAALRVAASFRKREEFTLVIVRGAFVVLRSAKSQSRRAMKKQEFQESKQAILEVIAAMIDVAPDKLVASEAA